MCCSGVCLHILITIYLPLALKLCATKWISGVTLNCRSCSRLKTSQPSNVGFNIKKIQTDRERATSLNDLSYTICRLSCINMILVTGASILT